MAERLSCIFYNTNNVTYTISVYDEEYVGSVIDFRTDEQGFIIDYQGEEVKGKIPILTSRCEVGIYVENQDIQDFIDDLNTGYEGQFRVLIDTGGAERWVGIVLPDLVQYEDAPFEVKPLFRLVATDGIKRLQTIPYKDTSGPFAGEETIIEHLTKCISFIGTTDLITTNSWTMVTAVNWVPSSIAAGNVLANTGFEHRALYQVDDKGNYKYQSVYRVLEQLCLRFDCQFRMVNGTYLFTQHNYHESATFAAYFYNASGTQIISGSLSMENTVSSNWTEKFAGGVYSFMPALNAVEVNYSHFGFGNIAQGYTWNQSTQPTIPESPTQYFMANGSSFMLRSNFYYFIVISGDRPAFLKFGFTFKVGTNYLQRDAGYNIGGWIENSQEEITTSAEDYELIIPVDVTKDVPLTYTGNFAGYDTIPIAFTTIPFPTGGAVEFTIAYIGAYDVNGNLVSTGINNLEWSFSNVELDFLPGANTSDWSNTKRYTAFNATTGNTERKTVNLVIGQELGFGRLRIATGSGSQDGTDWGVGSSSAGKTIDQLLAEEIIRTRAVPIRKLNATIQMSLTNIHQTMVHNSDRWVFYKGKFVGNFDWVVGEWYLLDTSGTTSGNISEDWVLEDDNPDGGNPVTPNLPPGSAPDIGGCGCDPVEVVALLDALFPRTNADIAAGATVTSIPIAARTAAGEWKAGQTITIVNQYTGQQQAFTVTADTAISDTSISVTSDTANFLLPSGSWIITSQEVQGAAGGSSAIYREEFPAHASATITVTENGGNLPTNAAAIRVYYDNGQIISPTYWSHSGSDITLTYTPDGVQSIWVEFNV